jgi:hypothetical protein
VSAGSGQGGRWISCTWPVCRPAMVRRVEYGLVAMASKPKERIHSMHLSEFKQKIGCAMDGNHLVGCHTYPIRRILSWILQSEIRPLSFAEILQATHGDTLCPLPSL